MKVSVAMIIDETEREDFEAAVIKFGFSVDDFELSELEDASLGAIYAVTGTVTVTRRGTKKSKTYRAGDATAWVSEFEDDLRRGVFQ